MKGVSQETGNFYINRTRGELKYWDKLCKDCRSKDRRKKSLLKNNANTPLSRFNPLPNPEHSKNKEEVYASRDSAKYVSENTNKEILDEYNQEVPQLQLTIDEFKSVIYWANTLFYWKKKRDEPLRGQLSNSILIDFTSDVN